MNDFRFNRQDGAQGEWIGTFNITNVDGTVIPVATQICFDSYFPEIFRLQAIQGAQVIQFVCTHLNMLTRT